MTRTFFLGPVLNAGDDEAAEDAVGSGSPTIADVMDCTGDVVVVGLLGRVWSDNMGSVDV